MCWSGLFENIPHIGESVFNRLKNKRDILSASEVCKSWFQSVSELMITRCALNIFQETESGQSDLINVDKVLTRQRLYNGVIVSSALYGNYYWKDLFTTLMKLNLVCSIVWARIDGSRHWITTSPAFFLSFGSVLNSLEELEINLGDESFAERGWPEAFQNLTHLKKVTLHNAHGRLLNSLQIHCRQLRKLVIKRVAFHQPLAGLLNFPLLEELFLENVYIHSTPESNSVKQVSLPCLKHLSISLSPLFDCAFENHMFSVIHVPRLCSISTTFSVCKVLQIVPGNFLRLIKLNTKCDTNQNNHDDLEPNNGIIAVEAINITARELVRWVNVQCPRTQRLDFSPSMSEHSLGKVSEVATRVLPVLKEITIGPAVYWRREE
ncbi:uncharacterized protein LOC129768723 [Toxorhynchites rutilus septentrionalis]|uniref:uncharacterized protein LOC129768723 n=1 Tax=Toxorhynchites rutilus septentrionalis TaxID=329112 RepID=UPI00247ABB92|nr:uncharacterized protein LOC129768723 [Toxorhynchites rutilus septentrionalis]